MKLIIIGFLIIVLTTFQSCTPDGPETVGFAEALKVADDVQTVNLMPWINQLAEVRSKDITVDCSGYSEDELFPACSLTRDASVKLVSDAFISMGYIPDTVVLGEGSQAAYNIVAEWLGTTRKNEVVLLASHLDAFYAGADDNASAVAAMLEAARAVRKHKFARTIRFVAFDLEEYGALGSTRYVKAGYANDVVTALVMDLIGYASYKPHSQDDIVGLKLPDTGDFLLTIGNNNSSVQTQKMVALGNSNGLAKLFGVIAPGDGTYFLSAMLFMRSDNDLLWFNGVPTIFLTDTANLRNPNYHKPTDTPETIDPEFLGKNTRLITASIALFAEVQQ